MLDRSPLWAAPLLLSASSCSTIAGIEDWKPEGSTGAGAAGAGPGVGGSGASVGPGGGGAGAAGAAGAGGAATCAWSLGFGSDQEDQPAWGLAVSNDGDVAVAGKVSIAFRYLDQNVIPNATDAFLARFAPGGQSPKMRVFGDAATQESTSVAFDAAGDVLLAGRFAGKIDFGAGNVPALGTADVFLAKLAPSGAVLFGSGYGDAQAIEGPHLAVSPDGSIWMVGSYGAVPNFGTGAMSPPSPGQQATYIARFDASGATKVTTSIVGTANVTASAVAALADGTALIGGSYDGSVNFGDGNVAADSQRDGFVMRYDANAQPIWVAHFVAAPGNLVIVRDLAATPEGGAIAVGVMSGTVGFAGMVGVSAGDTDAFVTRLDGSGKVLWAKTFGGIGSDEATAVARAADGTIFMAGRFRDMAQLASSHVSAGDNDLFVMAVDGNGLPLWDVIGGDDKSQAATDLALLPAPCMAAVVSAHNGGTLDLGTGPVKSAGGLDAFVGTVALPRR